MWGWLPWRRIVSRLARRRGLVDPIALLSRLENLAQPLEIRQPLELLRTGMSFHARGLLNTGAIQHNLDWIWPYWVERQFDPRDPAFVPRAFSLTHINLTLRNWTAVGLPDLDELPIVDPRGLLTPFWDGWSVDAWILADDGRRLIPSRLPDGASRQRLDLEAGMAVVTASRADGLELETRAGVEAGAGASVCRLDVAAVADRPAWLALALRPYNPEGVSALETVVPAASGAGWRLDGGRRVDFDAPADRFQAASYRDGDVYALLPEGDDRRQVRSRTGLATAAALFRLDPAAPRRLAVTVPLSADPRRDAAPDARAAWSAALAGACRLAVPDERIAFLFRAALRSLVLHSPGRDVYPGPFTYKRFWFRDAAFILHGLLCAGLDERARRCLDSFGERQTAGGHFFSQEAEWDSNGEALWILNRYCRLTGKPPPAAWRRPVRRGAAWIRRKRLAEAPASPHAGLFPPGFSAEHLGPNDYYYWDDFWGVAGLRAAADLLAAWGDAGEAGELRREADRFLAAIERSLGAAAARLGRPAMPASPYRRLDSGAIGSLAAGYPLQLWPAGDPRLLDTADHLAGSCFVDGGFFQDMIHSGINPYLTLQIAQVWLRAGDPRWQGALETVARLASPTGQWPEAVHPRTLGGCMGDGHHVWAAAEWLLMIRNCFVREEGPGLVLAAGIPGSWLAPGEELSFGPAPTPFGGIEVSIAPRPDRVEVRWRGDWRGEAPPVEVDLPGFESVRVAGGRRRAVVRKEPTA